MYQGKLISEIRRGLVVLLAAAMLFVAMGGSNTLLAQGPDDTPLLRETESPDGVDGARKREAPAAQHQSPQIELPASQETPVAASDITGQPIPDQYIVVFKDDVADVSAQASRLAAAHGGSVLHTYEHALQGFAVKMPAAAAQALAQNPNVDYVEPDQTVYAFDTQSPAPWGLDRIDQRDRPLDDSYTYYYTGSGVNAYVIDTGIRHSHNEFGGRARHGYTAINDGRGSSDCNGHGTHVAGIAGGSTYGVAKQVTLYAVRVLDCNGSGSISGVIAGVDWVTANHTKPAVANMSLGGSASSALDNAVRNSIAAGVTYTVSAPNSGSTSCDYSPARVQETITLGASDSGDNGFPAPPDECMDLYAPGSDIPSAWHTSDTATNTLSGTSMAAPHAAGVAALDLEKYPAHSPADVKKIILDTATKCRLVNFPCGPRNLLLYSLLDNAPDEGENKLKNGDFEDGPGVGWTESSSGGFTLITQDRPHTGSWGAWLGGYNHAHDTISQTVTVPSGGVLHYWVRIESSEPPSSYDYDYMEVRLHEAATGSHLATLRHWGNTSPRDTWISDSIDISAYAGQTVQLIFQAYTDSIYPTSFFIDDVEVN